jgi:hypothetical protein
MYLHAGDLDDPIRPGIGAGRLQVKDDEGPFQRKKTCDHSAILATPLVR